MTNILAKIVERAIASVLIPRFYIAGAFGRDQCGFRKKHSCKDLVAILACKWLWALNNGFKVEIYLSDISGAVHRVDREILADDTTRNGLSTDYFCSC